jgi:hypothetical protein
MLSIWTTPYILTTTLSRKIKISIEGFPLHPKPDAEVVPIGRSLNEQRESNIGPEKQKAVWGAVNSPSGKW